MKQNRVAEGLMRSSSSFLAVFQNAKGLPNLFKHKNEVSSPSSKALQPSRAVDVSQFLKAFGASNPSSGRGSGDGQQDLLQCLEYLTLQETLDMLEAVARQVQGRDRVVVMKAWCALLHQDAPRISQAATPSAATPGVSTEHTAANTPSTTPRASAAQQQQQQPSLAKTLSGVMHRRSQSLPAPADHLERKSTESMTDLAAAAIGDNKTNSATFRELFLQSQALEYLLQGYLETPTEYGEEQQVLGELLGLCLLGAGAEHGQQLAAAWLQLASAACGSGTLSALPGGSVVKEVSVQAICILKAQAAIDQLDQQIQAVQNELTLIMAQWNDTNYTSEFAQQDSGMRNSERWKLANQKWQLSCLLETLAAQRQAMLDRQSCFDYTSLLAKLEQPQARVQDRLQQVTARLADAQNQIEQGTGFRSDKFTQLRGVLVNVMGEISCLESKKAKLLAQLAQVDDGLKKLYRRQSLLEEERDVFEEGNAIMLEGLEGCVQDLSTTHATCVQEGHVLQECGALVQAAQQVAAQTGPSYLQESHRTYNAALDRVLVAGCQFCALHCAELAWCIEAMRFANTGVQDMDRELLENILEQEAFDDMQHKRSALLLRHSEAEAMARTAIWDFAAVKDSISNSLTKLRTMAQAAGTQGKDATAEGWVCAIHVCGCNEGLHAAGEGESTPQKSNPGESTSRGNTLQDGSKDLTEWPPAMQQLLVRMDELKALIQSLPRPQGSSPCAMSAAQTMDNRGFSFLSDSSQPVVLGVQLANMDHVSYSSLMGGMSPEAVYPEALSAVGTPHLDISPDLMPSFSHGPPLGRTVDVRLTADSTASTEEWTATDLVGFNTPPGLAKRPQGLVTLEATGLNSLRDLNALNSPQGYASKVYGNAGDDLDRCGCLVVLGVQSGKLTGQDVADHPGEDVIKAVHDPFSAD